MLDRLQDKVEELQVETMALEPLQDQGPAEAQETGKAVPKSNLGSRDNAFQALQGLQNPKMARSSGCFGRRMDRIGSFSSLGCNGEPPPCLGAVYLPSFLSMPPLQTLVGL